MIGLLQLKIQDSSNNGPDNENVFMPFESMSDINDQRDPEMFVFQPVTALLHKAALAQVREVLARRHNFNPKDDKSIRSGTRWMTRKTFNSSASRFA